MSTLHALMIGIDSYASGSGVAHLRGCVNDARSMAVALLRRDLLSDERLLLLLNEDATRSAVIAAWRGRLRDQVAPGDRVWVHFSGHGSRAHASLAANAGEQVESLVLWDSRLPGGWDLLDKEVAVLISEVEERGAQLFLFLDCCHAGGATRSDRDRPAQEPAVRACSSDSRPRLPDSLIARATRGDTASSTALVVAACLETQKAREHRQEAGDGPPLWHGALTWSFLRSLDEGASDESWAVAFDRVAGRVRVLYPQQTPQLTGPVELSLFGHHQAGAIPKPALTVLSVAEGKEPSPLRIQVDGGAALGLAADARVRLEPDGGRATVLSCTVDRAWAELDGDVESAPSVGDRVTLLAFGGEEVAAGVLAAPARVRSQLRAGASPMLTLARAADASFHLCPIPSDGGQGGWQILAADGELLAHVDADPVAAHGPQGGGADVDRLLLALEHLAIVRRVRALRNPSPTDSLRSRVELGPLLAVKPSRSSTAAFGQATALPTHYPGGPPVARAGQRLGFLVRNLGERLLYVTVLVLLPDWSIRRIVPDDAPRRALDPGITLPVQFIAPELPDAAEHAKLLLKVLVSTQPLSFDALQLPPLLGGTVRLTQPVRTGGELDDLLNTVRRGVRPVRSSQTDDANALWSALDVELRIEAGVETPSALPGT